MESPAVVNGFANQGATRQVAERELWPGAQQTLALRWLPVPETLPPDPCGGWFSPEVWLALSNGTVRRGKCLHKSAGETFPEPVHSWFVNDGMLHETIQVVAWMPFAVPDHPSVLPAPVNGR